jgi:hypothetical protein
MSKKAPYIIIGIMSAVLLFVILALLQEQRRSREIAVTPPDRYFDTQAIREYSLTMARPNAMASGTVVNNTWKTRDIGVWAGFVKPDGFHEGSTTGRSYYGYHYFPGVPPHEKRNFSITFAVPPLNRSWSVVAEFDPKPERLRPVWPRK